MIFWRVFMRISYTCPSHLKFSLTVEKWSNLNALSGDAIDWLDQHEDMYDVWLLVAYSATSCALVQVCCRERLRLVQNLTFGSSITRGLVGGTPMRKPS
jgi:hypothetical protein